MQMPPCADAAHTQDKHLPTAKRRRDGMLDMGAPTQHNARTKQAAPEAAIPSLKRPAPAQDRSSQRVAGCSMADEQPSRAAQTAGNHHAGTAAPAAAAQPEQHTPVSASQLASGIERLDLERTPFSQLSPAGRAMKSMPQYIEKGIADRRQERAQWPQLSPEMMVLGGTAAAAHYRQRAAGIAPAFANDGADVVIVGIGCAATASPFAVTRQARVCCPLAVKVCTYCCS